MIRRLLPLLVGGALMAAAAVPPSRPAAATGWMPFSLPGPADARTNHAWSYAFIDPGQPTGWPKWCIGLGQRGKDAPGAYTTYAFIRFKDAQGRQLPTYYGGLPTRSLEPRDYYPDQDNVCGNTIPPGAAWAEVGLRTVTSDGVQRVGWSAVFASESWCCQHPWYELNGWYSVSLGGP